MPADQTCLLRSRDGLLQALNSHAEANTIAGPGACPTAPYMQLEGAARLRRIPEPEHLLVFAAFWSNGKTYRADCSYAGGRTGNSRTYQLDCRCRNSRF